MNATSGGSSAFYGRVSYFHAGGIDKPLLITKEGVESVVPRETWPGQFHAGTAPVTGASRNCPIGVHTGCLLVDWPGMRTNAQYGWAGEQPDIDVWYGGLVDGMRDASGQMYMRNRYYDPATGQFTQTDPIGVAGGMNVYGFAAGDPVSYSDPYGLSACPVEFGGDGKTDLFSDCPPGSPGWYANRIATRQGSTVLNTIGGVLSTCGHDSRCIGGLLEEIGGGEIFDRALDYARRHAVRRAWREERSLVRATGTGTREWSPSEEAELLSGRPVSGYEGHHINDVASNLHLAGNPDNIMFVKKGKEHLDMHNGCTNNPCSGPLLDRSH